jgi:hypothetical protein
MVLSFPTVLVLTGAIRLRNSLRSIGLEHIMVHRLQLWAASLPDNSDFSDPFAVMFSKPIHF